MVLLLALGFVGLGAYVYAVVSDLAVEERLSRFKYRQTNGSWRAYFHGRPPSMSHVLHDASGSYYVCWDRPLRTEHEARQVAKRWMELYG